MVEVEVEVLLSLSLLVLDAIVCFIRYDTIRYQVLYVERLARKKDDFRINQSKSNH